MTLESGEEVWHKFGNHEYISDFESHKIEEPPRKYVFEKFRRNVSNYQKKLRPMRWSLRSDQ